MKKSSKEMGMTIIITRVIGALLGFSVLLTGFASCAYAEQGEKAKPLFTKHFNGTLFDITKKGEFSVEILLDQKEYKIGNDVIGIVIHNARDQDVEKASIVIDFRNLDTDQQAAQAAEIKEKGDGLYIVSNLDLKKEGRWKLMITVKKGAVEDSAQFLFPDVLKTHWPAGKYTP